MRTASPGSTTSKLDRVKTDEVPGDTGVLIRFSAFGKPGVVSYPTP
jgi:hypothetical protein